MPVRPRHRLPRHHRAVRGARRRPPLRPPHPQGHRARHCRHPRSRHRHLLQLDRDRQGAGQGRAWPRPAQRDHHGRAAPLDHFATATLSVCDLKCKHESVLSLHFFNEGS